ncbi:MAG: ATP-dependent DNA helicase RecG [Oscillospiraceae bacterium]
MLPKQLNNEITYVKGVGPKRAQLYNKLGVYTVDDLLNFFPRDYLDLSETLSVTKAAESPEEFCAVKCRAVKKLAPARIRKGLTVYKAVFTDDEADLTVVIYNSEFGFNRIAEGEEYILYGKVTGNLLRHEMSSPMIFSADIPTKLLPVYHLTEGLNQNLVRQAVKNAIAYLNDSIYEPMPKKIMAEYHLCSYDFAVENIHFPKDEHSFEIAKRRLVFDELMILRLGMGLMRAKSDNSTGCKMYSRSMDEFYNSLPFELTSGQKNAVDDCIADMCSGNPMNRLIQGDVGSGKTAVAAAAAYFAYKNGFQTAIMAPTEILAAQHYKTFSDFLEPLGIKVALLTGSLTVRQKKVLKEQIAKGEYSVVAGTHALVQQSTEFDKLGLVITDEQHRFGVEQRAALAEKGENPHKLVMSATPIPRTLALMIYGDLDISMLTQLPKGRQPVETFAVTGKLRKRAFGFVKDILDQGRQGYIVCPMIEENDTQLQDVKSYAKKLSEEDFKDYRIGLLHGRLAPEEKEEIMTRFKEHKIDLLVSTTVIEVGIDVPNAAVIVIENADRFGLSQLHQLRGRVGRGKYKSYCILITDNVTEDSRKRLNLMSKTADGFKISEEDLKLRGPGDFFGSRQHGLPPLKIADLYSDVEILKEAQSAADEVLADDSRLENPENRDLKQLAEKLFKDKLLD